MIAYLGLGSNIGDRITNLRKSISMIRNSGNAVQAVSSVFETSPVGLIDQPLFLNAAISIETEFNPLRLLAECKNIENSLGRVRTKRWGPRTIDIDILLYGSIEMKSEELTIPHPLMHERGFVLKPLSEIAGTVIHPVLGSTVNELLGNIDIGGISQYPEKL